MAERAVREFITQHYRHFNAAALIDAAEAYERHLAAGGRMFMTLAGAMSTAELGMSLAEMIRQEKVHAICCTGANLEEDLDHIEDGKKKWVKIVKDFYKPFHEKLSEASAVKGKVKPEDIATEETCEKCGKPMVIKWGRMGEFLACSGYPDCRNTMNFRREEGKIVPEKEEEVQVDEKCPECGAAMVMKRGRFGRFLACTRYPDCKGTRPVSIGVACPKGCGGQITERRSRRGRTFYGCSSYPNCDFVSWDRPRAEKCPLCGSLYLLDKYSKRDGPTVACPNRECGYRRTGDAPAAASTA